MSDYDPFVDEQKEEEVKQQEQPKSETDKPPADYLKVKLSTLGKLNAPGVVHVRDYSGKDAMSLSLMNEDNMLSIILDVANSIIYEGIDANYLHEEELQEIMLHVYYNFWGSLITDYPYPYTEEELEQIKPERKENILAGRETPSIDIPIANIETHTIDESFKEPFTLTDKSGKKVTFTLSRLGHIKKAYEYVENKYLKEEQEYGPIKELISREGIDEAMKKVSYDRIKEYNKYLENRAVDFATVQQAQTIVKVGSKTFDTLEQKVNAYYDIGLHMWRNYSNFVENLDFGVNSEVEVTSPLTGDNVIRRFQFRFLDFIPSMEPPDSTGYSVSYEE